MARRILESAHAGAPDADLSANTMAHRIVDIEALR
jgi:hypothetical protein